MNDKIRLIDVGARGGIHPRWKPFYQNLEVVAFEPDPKECAALNSRTHPYLVRFIPAALGAHDGQQATLFMCREPGVRAFYGRIWNYAASFYAGRQWRWSARRR